MVSLEQLAQLRTGIERASHKKVTHSPEMFLQQILGVLATEENPRIFKISRDLRLGV